ncbi:MAG: PPC domain-containing protein [Verrucomicrobiales bacterium]|nr:PPC domain-containing protein [Verrucomicrobiales bacterium]
MIKVWYIAVVACLFCLSTARGQLPTAELHSINPPAVVSGASLEVSLSGSNLEEISTLYFLDPDIKSKPVMLPESEYRIHPQQSGLRFTVTIPESPIEKFIPVRAAGYFGLSTSRPLLILPAGSKVISDRAGSAHHKLATAPALALNTKATGTTDSKQTDWWKISVKKDQRILVHCLAERIDSQADAVLSIVDGQGVELERNRDYVGRDPMLDFTAPADGNYWIGVHDTFYNGGTNFAYVLEASTRPWIDAVYPPAGKAGETFEATLIGRNLPGGSPGEGLQIDGKLVETLNVKVAVPPTPPKPEFSNQSPSHTLVAGFPYRYKKSNPVQIGISDHPVQTGDSGFVPPFAVAGRFDTEGEIDTFRFQGKKGTAYWIDVVADRVAGHIDPYIIVEKLSADKESGKKVKEGDDTSNNGGATFLNMSRDLALGFTADADAEYQVVVANQYASAGAEKNYWLSVRQAKPDFEVVAVAERPYLDARQAYPAAPLLRKGGTFPLQILLRRKDGFSGAVTISSEGLPEGVTCPSVTLSGNESAARLVFAAATDAKPWHGNVTVTATAGKLRHPVYLGTLVAGMTDYNISRQRTRLDPDFPLSVSGAEAAPATLEVGGERTFTVEIGKKLEIPVSLTNKNGIEGTLAITPVGLSGMRRPPVLNLATKDQQGKLTIDFTSKKNVFTPKQGISNFILKGTGTTKYKRNPGATERAAAQKKHTEALVAKYTKLVAESKTAVAAKKKELDGLTKNLQTASPDAKPEVAKAVAAAKAGYEAAVKESGELEEKRVQSEKEKAAAIAKHKAANALSSGKNTKIALWSLPLTVEVKPAPKK